MRRSTSRFFSTLAATPLPSLTRPSSTCSVPIYSWLKRWASWLASCITLRARSVKRSYMRSAPTMLPAGPRAAGLTMMILSLRRGATNSSGDGSGPTRNARGQTEWYAIHPDLTNPRSGAAERVSRERKKGSHASLRQDDSSRGRRFRLVGSLSGRLQPASSKNHGIGRLKPTRQRPPMITGSVDAPVDQPGIFKIRLTACRHDVMMK